MSRLPIVSCDVDAPSPTTGDDPVPLAAQGTVGYPGWLADRQGRQLRYLRLSVTDRCDLKCTYCMPEEGVPPSLREDVASFEELARIVGVFKRLGVKTVRLTGGEPLVRRGLETLIAMLRDEVGIEDIALTTNATAMRVMAKSLVDAGLKRVNVSLDSVDPQVFARITRGGDLRRVLDGIEAIQEAGIRELKINAVVVRGINDGPNLASLVQWAWDRNIVPRFIELMPLGAAAQLGREAVVSVAEMQATLKRSIPLSASPEYRTDRGPAGYLQSLDEPERTVGFIGAVTDNFCHRCNRVRITAKGEVRACLASPTGFSLRDLIRAEQDDDAIEAKVKSALFGKGDGHQFYAPGVEEHHGVDMSRIGG